MKNRNKHSIKLLIVLTGLFLMLGSCEYQDIRDADYPDQLIYMPASVNGLFMIDNVAGALDNVPTPGNPYRYKVDMSTRKMSIPLGVYRSGINNIGAFTVNIAVNTDTVNKLLAQVPMVVPAGTVLLPSDKYSTVSSVEMKDGEEIAGFDLIVDLDFLISNYPGKNYALGIGVSSAARKTNPLYATTVVVINTNMMKPTANFTSAVSSTDVKTWNFSNTSLMSVGYSWNFGDGTNASTLKAPSHTYAAAGTYTVTLTALGITDQENKSTKTSVITVL